MKLFIVRHAWAEERDEQCFPDDRLRPLTAKGKKRFRRVAKTLLDSMAPKIVATSPFVRCRQTADILVEELANGAEIVELHGLEPGGSLDEALDWLRAQPDGEYAWVGHAPDVSEMTASLIGMDERNLQFPKGAVAAIAWEAHAPGSGTGRLEWYVTARSLGC